MPKVGRQSEFLNATYGLQDNNFVTKNAPFGNNDSQLQRVRIVGGEKVYVKEDPHWTEKSNNAVERLHVSSPIARTWARHTLEAVPQKPNKVDRTAVVKLRRLHPNTDKAASPEVQQRPAPTALKSSLNPLNPHPVIPPIEETLDRISAQTDPSLVTLTKYIPSDPSLETLARYIPSTSYLSPRPIALAKADELRLMQRVSRGLGADFDKNKLKDVYSALVEHDAELTGYVGYTNIGYALLQAQVHVSVVDLRLLCSMYVSTTDASRVNYEKLLSFIAACVNSMTESGRKPTHAKTTKRVEMQGDGKLSNLHERSPENRDVKLRLSASDESLDDELDLSLVRQIFANADIEDKGTMSREQIKTLSLAAGFSIKEHEIFRVLDKYECPTGHGAYNWKQYLDEIEKTAAPRSKQTLISPRNTIQLVNPAKQQSPRHSDRLSIDTSQPPVHPLRKLTPPDRQDRDNETLTRYAKEGRKSRKRPESSPWFSRFMKMANAFYLVDADSSGHLPYENARWLVNEYNDVYNLDIPSNEIDTTIDLCSHDEQGKRVVGIDQLLRLLIKLGP